MSIVRRITRDPLTGPPNRKAATTPGIPPGLSSLKLPGVPVTIASSLAAKELRNQVEIYCRRWIPGRSILLGGDRGSGKTTLARAVIDDLLAHDSLAKDVLPLFVPIHGPDFFDGLDRDKDPSASSEPSNGAPSTTIVVNYPGPLPSPPPRAAEVGASPEEQRKREQNAAKFALKVLTIGLHRAFVTELGWALERAAWEASRGTLEPDDLNEVVAQLRLELDADVDASSLRWVWNRLAALESGVLQRSPSNAQSEYWTHQGLLEIVAVKSLIEAYIRVAGKVEDLKKNVVEAELKRETSSEATQKLANSIAGLLSGGAAGAGIFLQSGSPTAKALLGALAIPLIAFLTTTLLNVATKTSLDRKDSEERKITFDKSLESLDLIFPLLVNRVLDAGRAPIFVVDELDKVLHTDERLRDLIPRLKHIVSDKAFFCFLVGRDSFERIQEKIRQEPRGQESTFFSRRLYVNQSPAEWREYLIGGKSPNKTLIQSIAEDAAGKPLMFSNGTDPATRGSEASDLFRLSYYLLARSRMHAGELHRLIDSWPGGENLTAGRVLVMNELDRPQYKNQIIYQAAVEVVLRNPQIESRLAIDTVFRQRLYDLLYEPLERWERGEISGTAALCLLKAKKEPAGGPASNSTV